MLGFHRRPLPSMPAVVDTVLSKFSASSPAANRPIEDDARLLLFLPLLAPSLLPQEFCYVPPTSSHQPPAGASYAPSLLAYYGPRGHLVSAVDQAAQLVGLSGLTESLVDELEMSESSTEVAVALEEGRATGLTHGYLVRAQVLSQRPPKFTGNELRWKTCGEGWQFTSGRNGIGTIFVQFIVV